MATTKRHTKTSGPVQNHAHDGEPQFRAGKESRRFIRTLIWVLIVGGMFMVGQGLRYHFNLTQIEEIKAETDKLYTSVLGPDIGQSPFGRLQFEHGKLMATRRIGLDPLSVLAAMSRPDMISLRLEGLVLTGKRGKARGFFGPNVDRFDEYLDQLSDDEQYFFSLEKREEVFGGILFSLIVEPK